MEYQLSVIIPTYEESGNIRPLVERIDRALRGITHEIVFVDDSHDSTPDVIREVTGGREDIVLFHRENERGLATAVLMGFGKARGRYLCVMDADLQHPPEVLRPMYAAAVSRNADFCIPSRFIPGGSDGGLDPWRKFVSWTARFIGKVFLRSLRGMTDVTSGLFLFSREILDGADLRPIGWKIMAEVLAMTDYHVVVEIPYRFEERTSGSSKLDGRVTAEYIKQLCGLTRRELKHRKVRVIRLTQEETKRCTEELDRTSGGAVCA